MFEFGPGIALVVGGSGGLGSVICQRFAKAGMDVILTYRTNASKAERIRDAIRQEGRRAECRQLDLADSEPVKDLVKATEAEWGAIQTVCYAAGPEVKLRPIAELTPAQFKSVLLEDACGFFNLVHAALPALRRSQGSLIALATGALRRYPSLDLLSVAPKAAIEQIVKGVAREEGRNGVRANTIGTGWVDTGLATKALESESALRLREKLLAGTPLRRAGTPQEIADVAVFLASASSGYISGEFISVTGGGTT